MILHCVSCSNTWLSTRRTIPQHEMTDKLANALASHHPLQSECVIMCEQNRTQLDMFVFPSSFRSTTTTTYFCRHCWLDSRGLILQSNDRLAGPVHSQIGRNIVVSILHTRWVGFKLGYRVFLGRCVQILSKNIFFEITFLFH